MERPVENSAMDLMVDEDEQTADPKREVMASQKNGVPEQAGFEERLSKMIEKEVNRRFQSAKDKRWAQLEKQYGDLSELQEMVGALLTGSGEESAGQPSQLEDDLEERVRSLADLPGLKGNEDARALILRNMTVGDLPSYVQMIETLVQMTLGGQDAEIDPASGSAATAMIPGGSDAPGDLLQSYQRRKKQLRPGDVNAMTALKREFRHKGLDVF